MRRPKRGGKTSTDPASPRRHRPVDGGRRPRGAHRVAALGLSVLLGACGGAPAAGPTTPPAEPAGPSASPTPGHPDLEALEARAAVGAEALGDDAEETYAQAVAALKATLLPTSGDLADGELHDRALDLHAVVPHGGGARVVVGLTPERLAEVLSALAPRPLPDLPAPWGQAIQAVRQARLLADVCRARAAHDLGPCGDEPDLGSARARLDELLAAVQLRAEPLDGVPLREGRPLRAPTVVAEAPVGVGVAGLPVVAEGGATASAALDDDGRAELPRPDAWSGPVDVRLALDDLAGVGAMPRTRIEGRRTGLGRWTAILEGERSQGRRAATPVLTPTLAAALTERGYPGPAEVDPEARDRLTRATPARRARLLPDLAARWGGRVDVVLFVEGQTEFVARRSATQVWYAARGRLVARDAWTGEELRRVEAEVTASDYREVDADRRARRTLARRLVDELLREDAPWVAAGGP
ncbi:MAG: hypothetical protein ACFCGT_19615 [Sandaracinaceae bacterium]